MDKYIKRPPCYEHLAPVLQTLPCDTCHRHLAGSFRASCSGFCKVKSSYQKMCGMSKKIYRGNSWQNSWLYTRRGNSHRTSPEKTPEKKIIVRKKARYPLTPTFSVASSPATASPCCVITIPIVFLCMCVAWARKIPGAEKPYQPCGYGENASMFLAMRFLHSRKMTLCGKGSAQDWVAENS